MRRKSLFLCFFIFLATSFCFAQDADAQTEDIPDTNTTEIASESSPDFLFVTFGISFLKNAEESSASGGFKSAPSPVFFSPGIGLSIPRSSFITFAPRMQFSLNYYLWYNNTVLPAEIEHRTAIVPSIMLDLPAVINFQVKSSTFGIGLGVGVFLRYGFLAQGVPTSESADVSSINNWFYKDLHYLYPLLALSWDYLLSNNGKAGVDFRAYYPLSNAISPSPYGSGLSNTFDTGIISISARITPPFKSF